MLTPYDEFPVHQAPYPFSHIPCSDYAWDDGYGFCAYHAEKGIILVTGLRVSPNTDMIGGYILINIRGRQYTVRLSRVWRPNFETGIGPLKYEFIEPFQKMRITMGESDSDLKCDLIWNALAPALEEGHHHSVRRQRVVTDQTRYTQNGTAEGWIEFEGKRIEVRPHEWWGIRDHSWGLYQERRPLGGFTEWLPPIEKPAVMRAVRFWCCFQTKEISGIVNFHEDKHGNAITGNDLYANPFEGVIDRAGESRLLVTSARHKLRFKPGTKMLEGGSVELTDEKGNLWVQDFEVTSPPYIVQTIGYMPGSWKDGGTLHTYHGSETLAIEWDDFDFSDQPCSYTPYAAGQGSAVDVPFNFGADGKDNRICGAEFFCETTITDPQGRKHQGANYIEFFIEGAYLPYGFDE